MSLILSSLVLVAAQGQAASEPRLMRYPDVHGDQVVFTYAGDLWLSNLKGGYARRLTTDPGLETRSKFSPDGKWIAFTGQYDGNSEVYVIPSEGGEPKRLTFEPDADLVVGWTPDGKVMYTSSYGTWSPKKRILYTVSPNGGLPQRSVLTDFGEGSMSPDGGSVAYTRGMSYLFNWRHYRGGTQGRVSIYNFKSNSYRELPAGREQNYYPMWVGSSVFYVSDKNLGTLNLYRYDLSTGKDTQLTKFADADIRFPSTDGKTIVYERDGYLYSYSIADGAVKPLDPQIRSDFVPARPALRKLGGEIANISLAPSGNRVVVEARGELFSVPAKNGETRDLTETLGVREQMPQWSPDGKSIAYVSDVSGEEQVYVKPQLGGEATKLTDLHYAVDNMGWSPDSKSIVVADHDNNLWLVDVAAKKMTKVVKSGFGVSGYDFSPDSKWLVFCNQTPNRQSALYLYEIATGKSSALTNGHYDDQNPVFDQNGKVVYFVSTRTFMPTMGSNEISLAFQGGQRIYAIPLGKDATNPLLPASDEEPTVPANPPTTPGTPPQSPPPANPAQGPTPPPTPSTPPAPAYDLNNAGDRAIPLPMPAGSYAIVTGTKDGLIYASGGTIAKFDLNSRESTPLGTLPGGVQSIAFSFNPSRTKVAYYAAGMLGIVDVRPGLTIGQGRVDTNAVEAIIDPRKEWKQIFWEAWRYERDNYYDPTMRGLNWKAIGDRYAQYLPYVAHRSDLDFVLGLMLGELGTGHSYVSSAPMPRAFVPIGLLGADYKLANGRVQIARIFNGNNYDEARRGPLGDPGVNVKVGDYLLAIDGQPVTGDMDPNSLLIDKVGRTVVLTVNDKPTTEGSRTVRVRPVGSETGLRYAEWVEDNRRQVEQASGGRIGYMHIPSTSVDGAIEFIRGFYSQTDKDAMLIDERDNNGGFLPTFFVETLQRKPLTYVQNRHSPDTPDRPAIAGPKAMLIDEYAGSGGDMFPYLFRKAGVGPLIGNRTWGGLVGIRGASHFLDGGGVTAPEFAIYDPDTNEIVAENHGVSPDIAVDARPDLVAVGRDPQLEKAIDYLVGELKKLPAKPPRQKIPAVGKEGIVK